MTTFWRLLGFARPIRRFAIPYFFFAVIHAVFNTFNFVLIIPILNSLFGDAGVIRPVTAWPAFAFNMAYFEDLINYSLYCIHGPGYTVMHILILLAVTLSVTSLLNNVFRYLGQWIVENMKITTLERIRNTLFDNVMSLHVGYFSNERKGDIIAKISSDVQVVQFCVTSTLQVLFREPFLIIAYLFAMIKISWELTIFAGLFLPLTALLIGTIVKRLRHPAKRAQENYSEMVSLLDESLTGVKIIKGYNATDFIRDKFHLVNLFFSRLSRSMARRQQAAGPMSEFLGITAAAVLLVFGGYLVLQGKLEGSGFIAYLAIFSQITRPMRSFADAFSSINQGIAAGDRVLGLIDQQSQVTDAPDAIPLHAFREQIELRDVHFAYEEKEVIHGVSFTVRKGETVALVGPSGGGKSTLSDLIPRFYDVTAGEILIDGIDLRRYRQESLRAHMGIVTQETILFNDTIAGNIRLGKRDATEAEIEAAARVANADGFIRETPEGYGTNTGDRGMKLSGGQRQRLSIARAVLKNPDILILDEATSALDTESEKQVQEALNSLLKGRTSLVIAHRLSTIQHADRIIVIDAGRIVEQGTHQELIAREGLYARLIEMQQLT